MLHIEQKLRERTNIPVFHDDQHGTAIISTSPLTLMACESCREKKYFRRAMVAFRRAAAITACMNLLVALGCKAQHRGVRL